MYVIEKITKKNPLQKHYLKPKTLTGINFTEQIRKQTVLKPLNSEGLPGVLDWEEIDMAIYFWETYALSLIFSRNISL